MGGTGTDQLLARGRSAPGRVAAGTRDIQPNEELTRDYRHFMADVSYIAYL